MAEADIRRIFVLPASAKPFYYEDDLAQLKDTIQQAAKRKQQMLLIAYPPFSADRMRMIQQEIVNARTFGQRLAATARLSDWCHAEVVPLLAKINPATERQSLLAFESFVPTISLGILERYWVRIYQYFLKNLADDLNAKCWPCSPVKLSLSSGQVTWLPPQHMEWRKPTLPLGVVLGNLLTHKHESRHVSQLHLPACTILSPEDTQVIQLITHTYPNAELTVFGSSQELPAEIESVLPPGMKANMQVFSGGI